MITISTELVGNRVSESAHPARAAARCAEQESRNLVSLSLTHEISRPDAGPPTRRPAQPACHVTSRPANVPILDSRTPHPPEIGRGDCVTPTLAFPYYLCVSNFRPKSEKSSVPLRLGVLSW